MTNKLLLFIGSRYLGYGMQFLRGILVAKFLGPYWFGIWGFLMLVQQYVAYSSLGLEYAVNVELATTQGSKESREKSVSISLTGTVMVSILLIALGLVVTSFQLPLFEKYLFQPYAFGLMLVIGLTNIQTVLVNVYRVYGNLIRIAVAELLTGFLPLVTVLFFTGPSLITALLFSLIGAGLISLTVLFVKPPCRIYFSLDTAHLRRQLAVGLPLLVYAISFQMINIATRTIISIFYSVETLGYYSLANSLTAGTLMGLNAVNWVFFPNVLSRTHSDIPDHEVARTVKMVTDIYSTSLLLIVFTMILFIPVLFIFLPQYKPVQETLSVLLMAQAVLLSSYGYNCVAIARKRQNKVAGISFIAVLVVTVISLFAGILHLHFVWIAIAILIASTVYAILQGRLGSRTIHQTSSGAEVFFQILPPGNIAVILLFLIGSLSGYLYILGPLGLMIFLFLNREKLINIVQFGKRKVLSAA